jgi:hypothetical protein
MNADKSGSIELWRSQGRYLADFIGVHRRSSADSKLLAGITPRSFTIQG